MLTQPLAPPLISSAGPQVLADPMVLGTPLLVPASSFAGGPMTALITRAGAGGPVVDMAVPGAALAAATHLRAAAPKAQHAKPGSATPAEDPAHLPGAPCGGGGTAGVSAGCAPPGSGGSHGLFYALLFTLGGVAVLLTERVRLRPTRWRPAAFIALLERPG